MRNSRFSEAQIVGMLREFDAETPPKNSHVAKALTPIRSASGAPPLKEQ